MDGPSRIPGFYPETPAPSRYPASSSMGLNGAANLSPSNNLLGSIGRAGGPIRRTPAAAISRARAHSTPYARPAAQSTPGSGSRPRRDDDDDDEALIKKSFGEKAVEAVGTLIDGVKDWFSSSKTPRRELVQGIVPRKKTPQRSMTSRMEEGLDEEGMSQQEHRESDNMFSPSLAPHYAGHTPYFPSFGDFVEIPRWIVRQRSKKGALVPEPPIFPLPNTNPGHRRQESQSKYATLPAKRSNALVPVTQNKRPRHQASSSSLRPKEWELSRDRFAQHDTETLEWCEKFGIDIVSLANGTQKRPPLPSFADIQRFDSLRNDVAFFERQGIRYNPRHNRKSSSLRHATSSYELSRIAQENSAISSIDASDSASSKLHAWRELVRLKEARQKAERENAQLERSKQRNGYSPISRSASRGSSRVRGPAGEVHDDVWILPSVRPGSAGSLNRSIRMRTSSPQADGSWRSQGSRRGRPRGRDIFGTPEVQEVDEVMVDEGVQAGPSGFLMPPPQSGHSRGTSVNDMEVASTSTRKRPGYFSAREEDLDPLEMDIDEFVSPVRKKQRISVQGPKFASLWEPSRRENWPLSVDPDGTKKEDKTEVKDDDLERVKHELKGLDSPAFKLPPSARKANDSYAVEEDQPSPSKAPKSSETESPFKFEFTKPPASKSPVFGQEKKESNFKPTAVEDMEESKGKESPSKTSEFMQSILSEGKSPQEEKGDKASEKKNGVQATQPSQTETQSTAPSFSFSQPTSQSTFGGFSQKSPTLPPSEPKPVSNGFKFGSDATSTGFNGFGTQTKSATSTFSFAPSTSTTQKEGETTSSPPAEQSKGSFFAPTQSIPESKDSKVTAGGSEESKPAFAFNFGKPPTEESKKEIVPGPVTAAPTFGSSTGFSKFGSTTSKPETEPTKPLFGAPATTTSTTAAPPTDGPTKDLEPAPVPSFSSFGSAMSTSFKFGQQSKVPSEEHPQTESPAVAPVSAVPQELDDSMDITDSPPASRTVSIADPVSSGFKFSIPTSNPTSTVPSTAEAPRASTFPFNSSAPVFSSTTSGQINGIVEKPAATPFTFGAPTPPATTTEEKKSTAPATPAFTFGATTSNSSFGGFGSAFTKKEESTTEQKPVENTGFGFNSNVSGTPFGQTAKPSETKPLFGGQGNGPSFGGNGAPVFGGAGFGTSTNAQGLTSTPVQVASPAPSTGFNFSFNAAGGGGPSFGGGSTTTVNAPAFGGGAATTTTGSAPAFNPAPFTFGGTSTAGMNNPFASQSQQQATSPAAFPSISSAPVSPQNQQLSTFPPVQSPFGAPQNMFGNNPPPAATPGFQFSGQNTLPASPIFTLGSSSMQRSSSDAGPNNASPGGRRIAQPGRRRLNRGGR